MVRRDYDELMEAIHSAPIGESKLLRMLREDLKNAFRAGIEWADNHPIKED